MSSSRPTDAVNQRVRRDDVVLIQGSDEEYVISHACPRWNPARQVTTYQFLVRPAPGIFPARPGTIATARDAAVYKVRSPTMTRFEALLAYMYSGS